MRPRVFSEGPDTVLVRSVDVGGACFDSSIPSEPLSDVWVPAEELRWRGSGVDLEVGKRESDWRGCWRGSWRDVPNTATSGNELLFARGAADS